MAKPGPAELAAALRENLKKRKAQGRTPEPSYGSDEEGDVVPSEKGEAPGAWAAESSKKN